jgi:hypothetical protein
MKYSSRKKRETAVSAVVLIYCSHCYPKTGMSKGKNREKRKIMVLTRPKQGETKI